jgi:hydroxymethylglutaryl-CoA lyase
VWLVTRLIDAGIRELELGAFVRPDRVPQMADSDRLFEDLRAGRFSLGKARAWSLVPNRKGLDRALAAGVKDIAVFTAASETFNKRNIGMSVEQSLTEIREVVKAARKSRLRIRGYVSTAFFCPFEGRIRPAKTMKVVAALAKSGVDQVSIGDTIGMATPRQVEEVIRPAIRHLGAKRVAGHFHDTRGTALANALRSLELGVTTLDTSVGGLGGCPFAPGATGNLATEDLVFMLEGMGVKTGVDLSKLARLSLDFSRKLGRPLSSRYLQAFASSC